MPSFLDKLKQLAAEKFLETITSRKLWATVAGMLIAMGHIHLEEPIRTDVLKTLMVYVLSQGIADAGKLASAIVKKKE